ncbi:hypothetical protein R3P38DRAFT_3238103 [Favolaschia claudopus]|uniref:Uncharacterized protein n=1 Tax=Favolaschia claudopus TaxID=2862362 RepID=A0AAV9ZAI3_9AGAR
MHPPHHIADVVVCAVELTSYMDSLLMNGNEVRAARLSPLPALLTAPYLLPIPNQRVPAVSAIPPHPSLHQPLSPYSQPLPPSNSSTPPPARLDIGILTVFHVGGMNLQLETNQVSFLFFCFSEVDRKGLFTVPVYPGPESSVPLRHGQGRSVVREVDAHLQRTRLEWWRVGRVKWNKYDSIV